MKEYTRYLLSMGRIGCIGFGGGSALIPVIEDEIVTKQKLDTQKNLDKDVIVANITPGALPVEIAAAIGNRNFGRKGMVMGAFMMAFPGSLASVLILTILSAFQTQVLSVMEIASIIVSFFIIHLLVNYITKMLHSCRKESLDRERKAIFLMLAVFIMVCGKNIYRMLGLELTPVLALSTVQVLCLAFFCIFYSRSIYTKKTLTVMLAVGGIYLLSHGKAQIISNSYVVHGTELLMFILSCRGIWQNIRETHWRFQNNGKKILRDTVPWMAFLIILCVPAILVHRESLVFIGKGLLSALMSFGGGDAYLTIADGLFVESHMVTAKQYYGQIVFVVNMLPGSILCKTLTSVGYYIGLNIAGSLAAGIALALAGFSCSVAASCGFFMIIYHLYTNLISLQVFQMISRWIRPIIAGLLINIMLSLYEQCLTSAAQFSISGWTISAGMILLLAYHLFSYKCSHT